MNLDVPYMTGYLISATGILFLTGSFFSLIAEKLLKLAPVVCILVGIVFSSWFVFIPAETEINQLLNWVASGLAVILVSLRYRQHFKRS